MKEAHMDFFEEYRPPLPGNILFEALEPPREIVLAVNPRVTIEVIEGVLQAAKDTENIVILELALSEMNTRKGYTGMTPKLFAERVAEAAERVGWYGYVLHADHITVKKGTEEELENVKREIEARVEAGFTSFAIDSSFLFDRSEKEVPKQLKRVCETAIELFKFLREKMGHDSYGREGEVGEIGISEFTEVPEALHYVETLKRNGVEIHWLAIANGSKHGVTVDSEGNIVPQLTINLKRTVEIVQALWSRGHKTRIAQHGITGTPLHIIAEKFPKGMINKGNVGTFWMLLVWDILKIYEPELYNRIHRWVVNKYGKEDVPEAQTFNKYSKYAIKEFLHEIDGVEEETKNAIKAKAYAEALIHMKAFGMNKTAKRVYNYIRDMGKKKELTLHER